MPDGLMPVSYTHLDVYKRQVYDEVAKLISNKDSGNDKGAETKEKQSVFNIVSDFVSSIFSPIVPALAGAGMVKALLALLTAFSLVDKTAQTYIIINMIGDATFAFMPILDVYKRQLPAFIVASAAILIVSLATAPPSKEICDEFDSIGK